MSPVLLRGASAIAVRLNMTTAEVDHRHKAGTLPTFRAGGAPYATAGALDEWAALQRAGRLPKN